MQYGSKTVEAEVCKCNEKQVGEQEQIKCRPVTPGVVEKGNGYHYIARYRINEQAECIFAIYARTDIQEYEYGCYNHQHSGYRPQP